MIIGFSGYARSGKDTASDILVERHGFTKIAFADSLRDFLYAQNPIVVTDEGWEPLSQVIDQYGWDGYKQSNYVDSIRELIQRTGTEAGRNTMWENVWVDATMRKVIGVGNFAFSDPRFPNEADAIRKRGGIVIRINRPGVGPANNHPSETSLDDYQFDYIVDNDGTIEDLSEELDWLLFSAVGHGRLNYA